MPYFSSPSPRRFFLEMNHTSKYAKLELTVIVFIAVDIMINIPGHILHHYPHLLSSLPS